jgi:DNA mismatch repair protein PMS2
MAKKLADYQTNPDPIGLSKDIMVDRVYYTIASKACRKSIMIGDPLTYQQMNELVHGLSELDKPWMCPHGRPTFQHLSEHPSTYFGKTA